MRLALFWHGDCLLISAERRDMMLRQLSQLERETIIQFGDHGAGGDYSVPALNKLFTLDLIEINDDRRVVLTEAGRAIYRELIGKTGVRNPGPNSPQPAGPLPLMPRRAECIDRTCPARSLQRAVNGALSSDVRTTSSFLYRAIPGRADPFALLVRGGRAAGERALFQFAADGSVLSFSLGGFVYRRMMLAE
jgi:hypothetical protein